MTHKIISINRLRIAVTFLQGTFHPKYSTAICFEVSLFDISVELSPFAVKSMFWLSSEPTRLQEITYPDLVVARTDKGKHRKTGENVDTHGTGRHAEWPASGSVEFGV